MSKWLPPLLCPIPKGHQCHYTEEIKEIAKQKVFKRLFEDTSPWADLSKMRSTWNRIFTRRQPSINKRNVHAIINRIRRRNYNEKYRYAIIDSSGTVINTYKTISSARKDINKDRLKVKRHSRWVWKDLDFGSSIIPLKDSWDAIEDAREALPVANKKCTSCPNKTSYQGTCHCQFWASLKGDSVQKHRWMTPHEVKMFEHKKRKKEKLRGEANRQLILILKRS